MSNLAQVIDWLDVQPGPEGRWVAEAPDPGWGRLYGGLVMAQALSAAERTVPGDRLVHSLHGYFLRPGRPDVTIELEVDRIRDGRSFTTRRVVAQQDGEAIFSLAASFHGHEEGLEHADPMPEAPEPESLEEMSWGPDPAFHFHPAHYYDPRDPVPQPPHRQTWFKANGTLPDDPALHRRLLAWVADSHFLTTATQPHGVTWLDPHIQLASLDHAMWFHRDFRADQWLLYDVHSSSLSGSRGWVRGRFYTRDGRLIATTVQEGLIRDRRKSR